MKRLRLSVVAGEGSMFLIFGHNAGGYILDAVSRYAPDCGLSEKIVAKLEEAKPRKGWYEHELLITGDDFRRIYNSVLLWAQEKDVGENERWIRENLPLSFRRIDSLRFT